jgi:chromosome segregation ATPase
MEMVKSEAAAAVSTMEARSAAVVAELGAVKVELASTRAARQAAVEAQGALTARVGTAEGELGVARAQLASLHQSQGTQGAALQGEVSRLEREVREAREAAPTCRGSSKGRLRCTGPAGSAPFPPRLLR